jgi:outer membrane receptor protein involved in Fe transport
MLYLNQTFYFKHDRFLLSPMPTPYILIICGIFVCMTSNVIMAQTNINGSVFTPRHEPLMFASVALFQADSVLINATISDTLGYFSLDCPCSTAQMYRLNISMVGYKSFSQNIQLSNLAELNHIVLEEDMAMLKEVVVKAPTITRTADRYIMNIENSYLSQGNNAIEVLQKTPGLWVSSDGKIKIKGDQSVSVMIDNVLQKMTESELTALLQNLKSEEISKIEVIRNPSAEFDAEGTGGMLNIILKKARKNGLNGSFTAQYKQQGEYPYISLGAMLNYKVNRFILFGGYTNIQNKIRTKVNTTALYSDQSSYNTQLNMVESTTAHSFRMGMSYKISDKQTIGWQSTALINPYKSNVDAAIHYALVADNLVGTAHSEATRLLKRHATTLNYHLNTDTLGSVFKIIADYTNHIGKQSNDFNSYYDDVAVNSINRNQNPNATTIYTLQADYALVRPQQTEWKMGSKYSLIERDNNLISENYINNAWVLDTNVSNQFLYNERIFALYGSFHKKIKNIDLLLGIRTEQTNTQGNAISNQQIFQKNYWDWFPSLSVEYSFDAEKGNSIYFNQSRRINRPAFNELNPYKIKLDDYQSLIGNPDLKPEYVQNFEIGYIYQNNYFIDIYYAKGKDTQIQVMVPTSENQVLYQQQNFDDKHEWGIEMGFPMKLTAWWTSNYQISAYQLQYKQGSLINRSTSIFGKTTHDFSLKKLFDLTLTAYYRSPFVRGNFKAAYQSSIDLAISKKVWKEKAKITLSILDLLNTQRNKSVLNNDGFSLDFYQKQPTRTFSLTFTYSFSKGNSFNPKRIEQNNQEEKNRIGG